MMTLSPITMYQLNNATSLTRGKETAFLFWLPKFITSGAQVVTKRTGVAYHGSPRP